MAEDRMHILQMLQEKKISVEEAERLLKAVDQTTPPPSRFDVDEDELEFDDDEFPLAPRMPPYTVGIKPPKPPKLKRRGRHFPPGWDIRTSELIEALREFDYTDLSEHELDELRVH